MKNLCSKFPARRPMEKVKITICILFFAFILNGCGDDTTNNSNNNQSVDSNVVLRVDSVVLNTSNSLFVQQSFNFSKKLRSINFQYWGESNVPTINGPYIMLIFRSDMGDSVSFVQSGSNLDSIPKYVLNTILFNNNDSCDAIKIKLSINDTVNIPVNKNINVKNLKVFSN